MSADRLMAINIRLSDLEKELASELDCAAAHDVKAAASRDKAAEVKAQVDALIAERDVLPTEEGTA